MLAEGRLQQLNEFVSTLSKDELVWINGYLSGLLQSNPINHNRAPLSQPTEVRKITVVYGTETGNSKRLCNTIAAQAKKRGFQIKVNGLDQYRLTDLSKEKYLLVVISTQGEGEPPISAKKFFDHIHQSSDDLSELKYAVLGLGDTSYPLFCKAAEDVDAQLRKLGAHSLVELQKCDVDYEATATEWLNEVFSTLGKPTVSYVKKNTSSERKNYEGKIISITNLNDNHSSKETYHIEINTDDHPDYQPGDSIGVYPHNKKEVVDKILETVGIEKSKSFEGKLITDTIENLLTKHLNICYLSVSTVQKYASIVGSEIPEIRCDLLDLLQIYPVKTPLQFEEVIRILNPPTPRLYSISSSPASHTNEVHITVARNAFEINGELRVGLCSNFLNQMNEGDTLSFYIHRNKYFRLPAPDKDIIMIGPGTGIAPFRSFINDRDATAATGRNWLFFGDRNFSTDFLYQTEWQQFFATGLLTKINLAWSRDTAKKHYVQNELKIEATTFIEWMDNDAYLYVCGNKHPMSVDVENAILDILMQEKKLTREQAIQHLEQWSSDGRYVKDVY